MTAYYNDHEPRAAAWLRELIKAKLIAPGEVDERDIEEVQASDLKGFTQCHFFAGIGVWSYALRTTGWPDDSPVWTGSCPCQPFSASGEGAGFSDKRHVWPAWFRLISECRPDTIFGEQVASPAGLAWFDIVSSELEGASYAIGAADICAAGVGAPHIRQRLWWAGERVGPVAHSDVRSHIGSVTRPEQWPVPEGDERCGTLANAADMRRSKHEQEQGRRGKRAEHTAERQRASGRAATGHAGCVAHTSGRRCEQRNESERSVQLTDENGHMGNAESGGLGVRGSASRHTGRPAQPDDGWDVCVNERGLAEVLQQIRDGELADPDGGESGDRELQRSRRHGQQPTNEGDRALADTERNGRRTDEQERRPQGRTLDRWAGPAHDFWADVEWLYCKDGKYRPTKPGLFPLVNGTTGRVGRLRGYGNAIVPQAAAAFIEAYMSLKR